MCVIRSINTCIFRNAALRSSIFTGINKLLLQLHDIAALPVTLAHQDLAPFNYLIEESTGRLKAVLDWDGALYLPIGSSFHFMDSISGFMTPSGWQDTEDRQELETAFYDRVSTSLAAQGFGEQLELQKAIGILLYDVERLLKRKNERAEHYLYGHIQGSSSMNEFMFSE
ncbi:hypothetical protein N7492_008830 [Penicillium capsulatum]|uniref:Aminoglycoside phosphotransferase domain-containing protein n=1 Tax=Penicillium capsulatum TaxID=69766 RepID=A0A9W9LHH1_9EURO|nr:hypothetical protein N7492_008830 [Penicillium capsulatum]KAJ6106231.1 hypothetical protein N7512_009748 [Penicillium capsulatum]